MNDLVSGHRKRLREKYNRFGHDNLLDYEKIELLLTYALPRVDVKPLAKALLKRFGSIAGVLEAGQEELLLVPGIGENAARLIMLVRNLGADFHRDKILKRSVFHCSSDVVQFARMKLAGLGKEVFLVIYLNTRNEVIDTSVISDGTLDQVYIYIRELLSEAIKRNARGIILIHNHPGGSVEPSAEDKKLTENIRNAGVAMRVDLLDHLILTHNAAFSITMNQRVELGEESSYQLSELDYAAAEAIKKKYANLPFHPRVLTKNMLDLTGKKRKSGGEKK